MHKRAKSFPEVSINTSASYKPDFLEKSGLCPNLKIPDRVPCRRGFSPNTIAQIDVDGCGEY
jgi:hypothetical protein